MSFLDLAKRRYTARKFEIAAVEDEKLKQILEAGRVAPTAANAQPQRIIVVRKEEGLKKIKKVANIYDAPLALIVCSDHKNVWKRPIDGKTMVDVDSSIVTDHMMLQAADLGLGSVWIGYFDPKEVRKEFNIPEHIEPISILAIGYSAMEPLSPERHKSTRKPIEETVFYETF